MASGNNLEIESGIAKHSPTISEAEVEIDADGTGRGWLHGHFHKETLDRQLDRSQITGIAFSGAVGIGLFITCASVITMSGPVGAILSFSLAGLVIVSVMRSLAELASVRPVKGALMDYPATFIDEALGVAVGLIYWLANCFSMVTLTIQTAELTEYWTSTFSVGWATLVLLCCMLMLNCFGVKLYGTLERIFKWCKIQIIVALCILMIAIRAGAGPKQGQRGDYVLAPGYNATAFNPSIPIYPFSTKLIDQPIDIPGSFGRILAIWTCTTSAMFQFMGGEMVLITAAEAKFPRRDIPRAARFMYLLPVSFYLVAIILVGLNLNYLDPRLAHPHTSGGLLTGARSPFVIPVIDSGIHGLPGFLNACFLFSALTAANSALYVSSRTLFALARSSRYASIRNSLGRTNNGHTPLAAIIVSFVPGLLAFLGVRAGHKAFDEPISVLGRIYTGGMLCVYGTECLAFIRFQRGMRRYKRLINRDSEYYMKHHYRAHWQPLWAIIGLVACTLLMIFSGWSSIYDLCKVRLLDGEKVRVSDKGDLAFAVIADYLGPFIFFSFYLGYKFANGTRIKRYSDFRDVWFPTDVPDESSNVPGALRGSRIGIANRLRGIWTWLK